MSETNQLPERKKSPHIGDMLKKYTDEKRIRKAAWSRHQSVRKETITNPKQSTFLLIEENKKDVDKIKNHFPIKGNVDKYSEG